MVYLRMDKKLKSGVEWIGMEWLIREKEGGKEGKE